MNFENLLYLVLAILMIIQTVTVILIINYRKKEKKIIKKEIDQLMKDVKLKKQ